MANDKDKDQPQPKPEPPLAGFTREDLRELLKSVAAEAAKAATEAVSRGTPEEQEARAAKKKLQEQEALASARLAGEEDERRRKQRESCLHYSVNHFGKKQWAWVGQVHSDGQVHPVCNICHVEIPPFSAKLLPDEGRGGVGITRANPSLDQLNELHKASYPEKCKDVRCFVCFPKDKAKEGVKK